MSFGGQSSTKRIKQPVHLSEKLMLIESGCHENRQGNKLRCLKQVQCHQNAGKSLKMAMHKGEIQKNLIWIVYVFSMSGLHTSITLVVDPG